MTARGHTNQADQDRDSGQCSFHGDLVVSVQLVGVSASVIFAHAASEGRDPVVNCPSLVDGYGR